MNLMKELLRLDSDSLGVAISRLTTPELLGLLRPIAQTPHKWRGEGVASMYSVLCMELQGRNPARWIEIEHDLQRMEERTKRIAPFLASSKE